MSWDEKRAHPRVVLDMRAWVCKFRSDNEATDLHDCIIHDISEGGAQLFCNAEYHPGQLLMLTQQTSEDGNLQPLVGVITWHHKEPSEGNKYGIKFLNLSDNVLKEIQSIVARLLVRESPN